MSPSRSMKQCCFKVSSTMGIVPLNILPRRDSGYLEMKNCFFVIVWQYSYYSETMFQTSHQVLPYFETNRYAIVQYNSANTDSYCNIPCMTTISRSLFIYFIDNVIFRRILVDYISSPHCRVGVREKSFRKLDICKC